MRFKAIHIALVFFLTLLVFSPHFSYARQLNDMPIVELRSLDKITARTTTFQANVGSTVKFGPLYIKVQACRKAPPVEQPEASAFLQIWEVSPENKAEWVFSGWMYASSPGLSSMDHPIYDVWVLDCLEQKQPEKQKETADEVREGEGEVTEDAIPAKPEDTAE